MRFAYADPPYLGCAVRLYGDHPEAQRADAERYRWLRDATDVGIMRLGNRYKTDGWSIRTAAAWYDRDTLDEAIDAALAARGKDE